MPLLMCPNCNASMTEVKRADVAFDMCPTCRGVWLDRGELEKIIAGVQSEFDRPGLTPQQPQAPAQPQHGYQQQQRAQQDYRDREHGERGEYGERGERGEGGYDQRGRDGRRRRGGFDLMDIFGD